MRPAPAFASLLLTVLSRFAAAGEDPAAPMALAVPEAEAPLVDGRIDDGEWSKCAAFSVFRGDDLLGDGRLLRSGRTLFLAYRSDVPPFALGVRVVFADPGSSARIVALVNPLNPPAPPLVLYREFGEDAAQRKDASRCDIRFAFPEGEGFAFEARFPLSEIEIGAAKRDHLFSVQLWDLGENRAFAAFPVSAQGPMLRPRLAVLRPEPDWGIGRPEPADGANEALAILDALHREKDEGEGIGPNDGTRDGRRREAPLRAIEGRLKSLVERYPDYASLRAQLLRARIGLNDLEGCLEAVRGLRAGFPSLQVNVRQNLVELQTLRDLGRFDEAMTLLEEHKPLVERVPEARALRTSILSLRDAWKAESEIRAEEAARNDLPRVRLRTPKGDIVIELFEDDAPNVVAHFLTLCGSRFYDGTRFHWCEGSARVAGGDPNSRDEDRFNDGFGGPEKSVEPQPNRRLNLPYTVSMLDRRRLRRSEGSIFAINLVPFPAADGYGTVIGRVVEGEEIVRRLEYYDAIDATEVVRRRDHPYEPVYR